MTLYLATLTTSNFTFTTVGSTEVHALGLMHDAWDCHAEQTGARYTFGDLADDVNVIAIAAGTVLRDHEPFTV